MSTSLQNTSNYFTLLKSYVKKPLSIWLLVKWIKFFKVKLSVKLSFHWELLYFNGDVGLILSMIFLSLTKFSSMLSNSNEKE
jgi:hypothetical protein